MKVSVSVNELMAVGISVVGRQIVDILPGTEVIAYIRITGPQASVVKYKGYAALEVVAPNGVPYQLAGRSLWYAGVGVFYPAPQSLASQFVVYWREAGIDWETSV